MYVESGVSVYVVIIIVRWNANIKNYILDVGHGPRVLVVWRRRRRRRLIIVIAVREQFWRRWLRAVLDENRLDCGSTSAYASTGRGFVGGHWVAVIAQPRARLQPRLVFVVFGCAAWRNSVASSSVSAANRRFPARRCHSPVNFV